MLILRAQLLRGSGAMDDAFVAVQRAAALARESTTMSPLNHGQLLINAAQTAMAANRFDAAEAMASEGLQRWNEAKLDRSTGYFKGQTLLANLQLLGGQPRLALAAYEQMAAQPDSGESLPAAAARRSSQARALSVMARHDEAIALAQTASQQFGAAVGASAPDCLRLRLILVDVAVAASRSDIGRLELDAVRSIAGDTPAAIIAPALPAYGALLDLIDRPTAESVGAADLTPIEVSKQGPNCPRNALRLRLGAAERLLAADKVDLARALWPRTHPPSLLSAAWMQRCWRSGATAQTRSTQPFTGKRGRRWRNNWGQNIRATSAGSAESATQAQPACSQC